MEFITPKTDWGAKFNENGDYIGDFLNIVDYDRIKNNLLVLQEKYEEYNKQQPYYESMKELTYGELAFAEEWNVIERNTEEVLKKFGGLNDDIGKQKQFTNGGLIIDYEELNRLEKLHLKIYNYLEIEYKAQRQLAYDLGLDNIGEFSTITEE